MEKASREGTAKHGNWSSIPRWGRSSLKQNVGILGLRGPNQHIRSTWSTMRTWRLHMALASANHKTRSTMFALSFIFFAIGMHRLDYAGFDGIGVDRVSPSRTIYRRFFSVRLIFPMKTGISNVRRRTALDQTVWEVRERFPARRPLQYMVTSDTVDTNVFRSNQVERIASVRGNHIPLRFMFKKGRFIRASFDGLFLGCLHPADSLSVFLVLGSTWDSTVQFHHTIWFSHPFVRISLFLIRRSGCLLDRWIVDPFLLVGSPRTVLPKPSTQCRLSFPMPFLLDGIHLVGTPGGTPPR